MTQAYANGAASLSEIVSAEVIFVTLTLQLITLILLIIRTNALRSKSEEQITVLKGVVERFTKGLDDMKNSIATTLNKLNDSVITLDKAAEKMLTLSKTHYDSDVRDHLSLNKEVHNLTQKVDNLKDKQMETLSEIRNKN